MKMEVEGFKELFDSFGEMKKDLTPEQNSPLNRKLIEIGNMIIEDLKSSLDQHTKSQSLRQSIGGMQDTGNFITVDGENVSITIGANEYWKYINSGVNGLKTNFSSSFSFRTPHGNRKMVQSLQEGMRTRGITLPVGFKSFESYAWASARKLKRDGIEPNHFVDNVLSQNYLDEIAKTLSEETSKIISLSLEK